MAKDEGSMTSPLLAAAVEVSVLLAEFLAAPVLVRCEVAQSGTFACNMKFSGTSYLRVG